MDNTFAARLNLLFASVYPPGREPFTAAEVLHGTGRRLSPPYLSQLRSGERTHPSQSVVDALALFFRIRPEYFTDDDYYLTIKHELVAMSAAKDPLTRRIATRAIALSPESKRELLEQIEELRAREHLDGCP